MKQLFEFIDWVNGVREVEFLTEAKDPRTPHPEDNIFNGVDAASETLSALESIIKDPRTITIKWDGKPALIFGYDQDGKFTVADKYMFDAKFLPKSPSDWIKYDRQKASGKLRPDLYDKIKNIWKGLEYAASGTTGFFWGDLLWAEKPTPVGGNYVFTPNTVTYTIPVNSEIGKQIAGKVGGVVVHQYFVDIDSKPVQWNGRGLKTDGPVAILTSTLGLQFKLAVPASLSVAKKVLAGNSAGVDEFLSGLSGVARAAIKTYMNKFITKQTTQNLEDWLATNISASQYKFLTQPDPKNPTQAGYLVAHKAELKKLFNIWNALNKLKNDLVAQLEKQTSGFKQSIGTMQGGEGFIFNTPFGLIKLVNRGAFSAANFSKNATKDLMEGGNVFKSQDDTPLTRRILKAEIPPTISWLENLTGLDFTTDKDENGYPVKWLGSTGKKADSGDLDLGIDASQITKDELVNILYNWCLKQGIPQDKIMNKKGYFEGCIQKTGISVHFKAPIGGNPKNGYVQTDFMFLQNPMWSAWYMSSDPSSEFKGEMKNIFINSVAKGAGYKVDQNKGLFDRGTGEFVTDNPDKVAKLILSQSKSKNDLMSVESILLALKNDPGRQNKIADFKDTLLKYKNINLDDVAEKLNALPAKKNSTVDDKQPVTEEAAGKEILVVYPGGFHPFHRGHSSVYNHLTKKFPGSNVYVAATDTRTERPFSFDDKQFLAGQSGVPADNFVQVKSPYQAKEITQAYDPAKTVLVFAVSEKDKDRFNFAPKKDGSPSYFQPWGDGKLNTMDKHGYIYVVPKVDFKIAGQTVDSASKIRNMYSTGDEALRKKIVSDLYPGSTEPKVVKKILDSTLGGITEADNPNYFGGSSVSAIPGTPADLMPGPSKEEVEAYHKEMVDLKRFMRHR